MLFKRLSAFALALGLIAPFNMAQADQTSGCLPTSSLPGLTLVNDLNAWIKSASTTFSGTSAPATDCSAATLTGQAWVDTTTSGYLKYKLYDGTSSVESGRYDTTNHWWVPPVGGGTATIASATTTDSLSVPQHAVTISGTTTITALASSSATPGTRKAVTFSGALTLTHNGTSLILPGAVNRTTAAGDTAEVEAITSTNVRVRNYVPATGLPVTPLATIAAHTFLGNITGSTSTPVASSLSAILDAEMGSTRGQILFRGTSTWGILAVGTAGQLLQSGGAGADVLWATVSAPVLLATLTASNSASLSDTTHLTSTYPAYKLVWTGILPATNATSCRFKVNVGGVQSANYTGVISHFGNNADTSQTTYISCSRNGALANTGTGISGEMMIYNPSQTSSPKAITFVANYRDSTNAGSGDILSTGSYDGGNGAVTGFQVDMAAGNITSGTIKIYGLP